MFKAIKNGNLYKTIKKIERHYYKYIITTSQVTTIEECTQEEADFYRDKNVYYGINN